MRNLSRTNLNVIFMLLFTFFPSNILALDLNGEEENQSSSESIVKASNEFAAASQDIKKLIVPVCYMLALLGGCKFVYSAIREQSISHLFMGLAIIIGSQLMQTVADKTYTATIPF